jgi:hypothetical protein
VAADLFRTGFFKSLAHQKAFHFPIKGSETDSQPAPISQLLDLVARLYGRSWAA